MMMYLFQWDPEMFGLSGSLDSLSCQFWSSPTRDNSEVKASGFQPIPRTSAVGFPALRVQWCLVPFRPQARERWSWVTAPELVCCLQPLWAASLLTLQMAESLPTLQRKLVDEHYDHSEAEDFLFCSKTFKLRIRRL